ncbi:hypothetical protein RN001_002093 [Aquatica leii]|uniref:Uncharacterized protein n=1 Tax=Aquatica leii TaxID=1421715 RepID=A0AAN7PGN2_9COLE|nr:hypothetical protein RN001_002093 [Aquatica leii]
MCSNSFCTKKKSAETNHVPELNNTKLFDEIKKIVDVIIRKADRIAFNETTNQAERYMGLLAKFTVKFG